MARRVRKDANGKTIGYEPPRPLRVIFDMDGVLAVYDESGYVGKEPLFEKLGQHWFARCQRDARATVLMRAVAKEPYAQICVCSRISGSEDTAIGHEQAMDKRIWLARNVYPYNDVERAIISPLTKPRAFRTTFNRAPQPTDVLIDDYNDNLEAWVRAGGRAVKWVNGQNDASSWDGPSIDPDKMDVDSMLTTILRATCASRWTPLVTNGIKRR